MDDDIGSQYADHQAQYDWAEENDACPECETKYDKNGYCDCPEEDL